MVAKAYKPTKLKILEGNRGKRPLPENEPKPVPKAPRCPSDLDKGAKNAWKRLAPKLERMGLLTEVDGDSFAIVCQIRSRLKTIHDFIRKENPSLVQEVQKPDPDGGMRVEYKPSPYVVMEKQYYQLFRMAASEFGLSPRSRVGLGVRGDDSKDDMDEFFG
jgi:P27 family predicted phage terminase small subunit